MYVNSLSRTFLVCLATLVLTACGGGGGGGGGGTILDPAPAPDEEEQATGSLELSIIFDGGTGNDILAGNERATLQAIANEEGATGELVVRFSTTGGTLVTSSAETSEGIATVEIIGDGSGTPATVTASVTLSDGKELSNEIIVQMAQSETSIALSIIFDEANEDSVLAGNEQATLQAIVNEEGSTDELVVRFTTTGGTLVDSSASTNDGIATVGIIGDGSGTAVTVTATVTLSDGTEISDEIIVQMAQSETSIALSIIFDEANEDGVLAGNEQATLQAIINEEGSTDELVVTFSATGGTLVDSSAATSDGIATVGIIGDGSGTAVTVTATVTLSDGTEISDDIIVQMAQSESSVALSIIFDEANEDSVLGGNEQATLQAIVNEEGSTDELVVQFSTTGGTLVNSSAATSDGIATVGIIGDGSGTAVTVTATVTLSDGTEISDEIIVQMSSAISSGNSSIALSIIFDEANEDSVLAGNERATLQAIANEEGATGELVVRFTATGGTLVTSSDATNDGIATVEIIGDGSGTPATVTAAVTLSDGTEISDEIIVQMAQSETSIALSIIFDEANEDSILVGNEQATLQAIVNEEGSTDELVVRFTTTGGTLVDSSASTNDGIATVGIIGDGSGTAVTVTATVTLSDGTEISDEIIVQMAQSETSIALSIIFDEANEDSVLAGNELATLQAIVNDEGSTDELVVQFSTTGGTLVDSSAATNDGIATVGIIGDGSGTAVTVTATVTLSDGTERSDEIIVQMAQSETSIALSIIFDEANEDSILVSNEQATLQAIVNEEGSTDELVVRFSTTGGTLVTSSAATSEGIATVVIIGDGSGTPATVTAAVTLSDGTELSNEIIVQMAQSETSIALSIIFDEANEDGVLVGNEQATLQAIVNEEGSTDELVVTFSATGGTLVDSSAATSDGIATVGIIGDGSGTAVTVTATVTLSDGTERNDEIIVQMAQSETSIALSIIFDEANEDSILVSNEQATLQAIVNEEGSTDELVVQFSTTGGTLVDSSASTNDGIATVGIIGDGSGTAVTVTATVTLSDGTERSDEIIVQMAQSETSIALSIIFDEANEDSILVGNEQATLQAIVNEEGSTDELVVRFSATGGTLVDSSAATSDGIATVGIIGDGSGTAVTVTATVTLSDGTERNDEIIVQMAQSETSIALSIIFDEANEDSILVGNEQATLQAIVNEEGSTDELVVRFSATGGTLVDSSAATSDGIATVGIIGDGSGTAVTVTATVTLSDGTERSDEIIVQMAQSETSIALSIIFDEANENSLLALDEQATLQAIVNEEGADGELVVRYATTGGTLVNSNVSTSNGIATVAFIGDGSGTPATVTATVTLSDGTELSDEIIVQMSAAESSIELSIIFNDDTSGDDILAGNERATLQAIANEEGATGELVVVFSTTGGTLVDDSAVTVDGTATVDIIGAGVGIPATVTAEITLSDGTTIAEELTVQMSSDKPEISVVVRNINGIEVTQFDSNVELTAEATVIDWDGGALEGDDTGLAVTFTLGAYAETASASAVTAFEVCPVVGIKDKTDCAFINFTSSTTAGTGDVIASATINGIAIEATLGISNTGTSGGIPDQNSFNITRIVGGNSASESDTVALEGDEYNNEQATIRVNLGDYQENPVPDGAVVQFRTELGSITPSCEIASGTCDATFASGEPRSPTNSGVSFQNLDDDNCPSNYIEDEQVTVSGTTALTDYRVADVLRVRPNNSSAIFIKGVQYTVNANGINCTGCANGQVLQITYQRLWLDEENDGSTAHVMLTPGAATEPFLDVQSTPCFASSRGNLEGITGSIEPAASTTVTGINTLFLTELAVGDRIKVGNEVRTVASIASDTSLAVTAAFTAAANDTSPERMAAPAYLGGLGQPYGARSTILAWTQGEESFDDTNANGEYDFGEAFNDLPEAFLDKNEDGVLDDNNGDSASAGTLGPYRDSGLGTNAPTDSEVRLKNNPYCYGPETIVAESGDGNDSTEANRYCYQDGGEEEDFIDANGNNLMDAGNGIYNGSRCINPEQDGATVCTTDLIDVRREVQVTLAGSRAKTAFRATGGNGLGGAFGGGEIIRGIENRSGDAIGDDPGLPETWTPLTAPDPAAPTTNISATVLGNNLAGFPQGGAQINTSLFNTVASPGTDDKDEEVSLFSIANPFSRTQAIYEVSFDFDVGADLTTRTGGVNLFINGVLQYDNCTDATPPTPVTPVTCTVSDLTASDLGDLLFVVSEQPATFYRVVGTISNVQITGTTTGTNGEFRSTEDLVSNDLTLTNITEFNIGEDLNNSTVFPGVSQRKAPSGNVPSIFTTQTSGVFWFTDRFNGQLPDGTTVQLSSAAATGCQLTSVGGRAVTTDTSDEFDVGTEVGFGLSFSVTQGAGGAGAIVATVTTPIGNQTPDSISCNLLN